MAHSAVFTFFLMKQDTRLSAPDATTKQNKDNIGLTFKISAADFYIVIEM